MIEEHKAGRETEPLVISKGTVKCMLKSCGVADSHVATFDQQYDAAFGADTDLSPRNLVDAKQLEPVSYTHLDVYKRQFICWAMVGCLGVGLVSRTSRTRYCRWYSKAL